MANSKEIKKISDVEFDQFWARYPKKTARLAAVKAFWKARRTARLDEILAGVDRYVKGKPTWAEWAYPASWLNAGRWTDEYEPPRVKTTASDWWDECKTLHGGACAKRWDHDTRMKAGS